LKNTVELTGWLPGVVARRALQRCVSRTRVPLIPREGQNALERKPDTLALKHEALKLLVAHAVGPWTGATLSINDAMPRDAAVVGKGMKRVAHEAGVPGKAGEECHLAVGGDATARDAPYNVVDERVCRGGRRH
jgi:hypothetical protein